MDDDTVFNGTMTSCASPLRIRLSGSSRGVVDTVSDGESNASRNRGRVKDRPTVRDVVEVAGVSFKTVSWVINGGPGVRPATAERVMTAVRELGFRRSVVVADFTRGGSRNQTGLVVDDASRPFGTSIA